MNQRQNRTLTLQHCFLFKKVQAAVKAVWFLPSSLLPWACSNHTSSSPQRTRFTLLTRPVTPGWGGFTSQGQHPCAEVSLLHWDNAGLGSLCFTPHTEFLSLALARCKTSISAHVAQPASTILCSKPGNFPQPVIQIVWFVKACYRKLCKDLSCVCSKQPVKLNAVKSQAKKKSH